MTKLDLQFQRLGLLEHAHCFVHLHNAGARKKGLKSLPSFFQQTLALSWGSLSNKINSSELSISSIMPSGWCVASWRLPVPNPLLGL